MLVGDNSEGGNDGNKHSHGHLAFPSLSHTSGKWGGCEHQGQMGCRCTPSSGCQLPAGPGGRPGQEPCLIHAFTGRRTEAHFVQCLSLSSPWPCPRDRKSPGSVRAEFLWPRGPQAPAQAEAMSSSNQPATRDPRVTPGPLKPQRLGNGNSQLLRLLEGVRHLHTQPTSATSWVSGAPPESAGKPGPAGGLLSPCNMHAP